MKNKNLQFETLQVHAGQSPDPTTAACAVPIYATTSYVFNDCDQARRIFDLEEAGNIYTRITNPTTDVFEQRIAALEGGVAAVATASGMSATSYAVQNIAVNGDHIVSANTIYGGTYNLFANLFRDFGIETTFIDGSNPENFENAIKENTKALFIESVGNPNATIINIEAVAQIAHKHGLPLIVDNTFATPYLLRPIEHGADIVVHSATKFIGGHGSVIGGVVVDGGTFDWKQNNKFAGLSQPNPNYHGVIFADIAGKAAYAVKMRTTLLRDMGSPLSPFHSFMFIQGLETLSLRVERHVANALKVVDFLSKHQKIKKVNHPSLTSHPDNELYKKYFPKGGASIFTVETKGSINEAKQFVEKLQLFSLLANVADVKSLVIHPATTTHGQMTESELLEAGVTPTTIRLSIGIEHIDDIIADLDQALNAIS